jgi:predicted enzyme related to lactoylglutathione lyase
MSITDIAFTGIPVSDMTTAKTFYGQLLQAEPMFESPDGRLVEYRIGSGILTIGNLGDAFKPSSQGTFVALEADEFESEMTRLSKLEVNVLVPRVELPTSVFSIIADPDGNKIMIHKTTV